MHRSFTSFLFLVAILALSLSVVSQPAMAQYSVKTLVSNTPTSTTSHTDPNLVNAWGLGPQRRQRVLGQRQRHRSVHALQRRRHSAVADRKYSVGRSRGIWSADRNRVQRLAAIRSTRN